MLGMCRRAGGSGLVKDLNIDGVAPVGLIDTALVLDQYGYHGVFGRSDGMHVDYDRAEAFAAGVLGPALLDLLGEPQAGPA